MSERDQLLLFDADNDVEPHSANSSTFVDNMKLPVHRWFRYSAGFSAQWAQAVIEESLHRPTRVLDPFAGSVTTLIAAEDAGAESCGIESHPFVFRVGRAKLSRRSDPDEYREFARSVLEHARQSQAVGETYPDLIQKCYEPHVLQDLDRLRQVQEQCADGSVASELTWLTLVSVLRKTSHVGTANWQYVLPKKSKKLVIEPFAAFEQQIRTFHADMVRSQAVAGPVGRIIQGDARNCDGVPSGWANLVVTSPPYPNNYDYADATRLEMSFMRQIAGWGDLQSAVRQYLVRSCSQHVPEKSMNLAEVLSAPELAPIIDRLLPVCEELGEIRLSKGGKKTYHLMVACYFLDLAKVWLSLRRVCDSPSQICFVIGDSAPYGVYVPVIEWLGDLALAAGFKTYRFEKIRDRNIKWKNRKHRVPLCEGRLWVAG